MKWKLMLLAFLGASPLSASADQYEWVSLREATGAQQILLKSREIQEFCAPCGDLTSKPIRVDLVEVSRVWEGRGAAVVELDGESFWQILVNDQAIDFAYLYVRRKGRWENLAMIMGLEPHRVPRYLESQQLGR
ncbi:hypothetical protein ACFPOA_00660 [Lysobacter niabensis]|uniref:hypothetical protein n=1 Tax=Agrilutibacter niabensis TaxID=380628 RepID=UPI0036093AB6